MIAPTPTGRQRKTLYPACRLWRAELNVRLDGQDPMVPDSWIPDELFDAASAEAVACGFAAAGDQDAARIETLRARCLFFGVPATSSIRNSEYRQALHDRAVRRLGATAADELVLKRPPRSYSNRREIWMIPLLTLIRGPRAHRGPSLRERDS